MDVKRTVVSLLAHPAVGRVLRWAGGGRVRSLRFPEVAVRVGSSSVSDRAVALIFWGVYESAELRFVRRFLRRDLDVVELGSSIGVVSTAIARRLEPGRRLVCVEANPDLLEVLRANLAAHAAHLRLEVVPAAVAYGCDAVPFEAVDENTGGHLAPLGDVRPEARSVPALGLGQVLDRSGIQGDYALVADIEGAEAAVLEWDEPALGRCRQAVIELHDTNVAGRAMSIEDLAGAFQRRHGFKLTARRGPVCVFERDALSLS